jgi:tRNA(Ile)-lysidine synthase
MSQLSIDDLHATLMRLGPPRRLLVAFSGGMDSTVLLHALTRLRAAHSLPVIEAVHIDHGLSPSSAEWSRHCEDLCRALGIALHALRIQVRGAPGDSPEAAAREARYEALRSVMSAGDALVTAHHRDDQAETLLLQLLRGAGPAGLAGMAEHSPFGPGRLLRPLLGVPRSALRAYARAEHLRWIEDESNLDTAIDRNFLRREIVPPLSERWPGISATLLRAARLQAEADRLCTELAEQDVRGALDEEGALDVEALRGLSEPRQRNLLRHWLRERGLVPPPRTRLETLRRDMLGAGDDRNPHVAWRGGEVRRYRRRLYAMAPLAPLQARAELMWYPDRPLPLPWLGQRLVGRPTQGEGIAWDVAEGPLQLRWRAGGERCRIAGRAHRRVLKKLFQEAGVPPWQRERTPLLYKGEDLVAVVGYWYCEPWAVRSGETGWVFALENSDPSRGNGRS